MRLSHRDLWRDHYAGDSNKTIYNVRRKDGILNVLIENQTGFWANTNKRGGPAQWSDKHLMEYAYPATKLKVCEHCGHISRKNGVRIRYMSTGHFCWIWKLNPKGIHFYSKEALMCSKCWKESYSQLHAATLNLEDASVLVKKLKLTKGR